MKVALIQLGAGSDKAKNFKKALDFTLTAARKGAELIVLPEVFLYRGPVTGFKDIAEPLNGETVAQFSAIAAQHSCAILLGSILEKSPGKKYFNTSVFIAPDGRSTDAYRKMNLFDAVIDGRVVKESLIFARGSAPVIVEYKGFRIGLTICFDLRFPELYRWYGEHSVDIICVPSCFTKRTGEAHWEILLRARAVENLCYVLAPNQIGKDYRGIAAYGNTMIVDPWGKILTRAGSTKEEIVYADISKKAIAKYKKVLPKLKICRMV